MAAVTYGVARVPSAATAPNTDAAAPRLGWLARFYDALIESRMKSAQRVIAMHAHLLPPKTRPGDMPFGGW